MTPKRTDAFADLFGFSIVQVINLDHPLEKAIIEGGWKEPPAISSLRGQLKGEEQSSRQLGISKAIMGWKGTF
jgi:hypothetical protein